MMAGPSPLAKSLAALVTALSFGFLIAWYGFLEPPFLSYRNVPFETTVESVRAGETIPLKVTRCSSSDVEEDYLIARRLIRLDQPPADPTPAAILPGGGLVPISPGCVDEISKANQIPPDTKPGTYFIDGHAKVDGKWRSSKIGWSSRPFVVLPPAALTQPQ